MDSTTPIISNSSSSEAAKIMASKSENSGSSDSNTSSTSSVDSESENDELFVSGEEAEDGEEEFVEAAEGDEYDDEGDVVVAAGGVPALRASEGLGSVRPIARVTVDEESSDVQLVRDDVVSFRGGVGERLRVAGITESEDDEGVFQEISAFGESELGVGEVSLGNEEKGAGEVSLHNEEKVVGEVSLRNEEKGAEVGNLGLGEGVNSGGDVSSLLSAKETVGKQKIRAQEDEMSKVVEEGTDLDSKTDGVESGDGKVVEGDSVKVTSLGDSVVECVDVDFSGSGVAIVRNVEESKASDDGGRYAIEKDFGLDDESKTDGVESSPVESGHSSKIIEADSVKVTSLGDSIVEDVNVDFLGSGVAIVANVDEDQGSDNGDKGAAVVESETVNVENQFDVEEPLELKSEGQEPKSAKRDENAELESEQNIGAAGYVKIDAAEARKLPESVVERHENGGLSPVKSLGDDEFPGLIDDKKDSAAGPPSDLEVGQKEPTLETHVPIIEPMPSAREDKLETGIEEKNYASYSHIGLQPLPEMNTGTNSENQISEFTQEWVVKPNAEDIQKQYPEQEGVTKGTATDEEPEQLVFENSEVGAFKESEQVSLSEINVAKNAGDENSEFAQQREVKPHAEDIQKQYLEGDVTKGTTSVEELERFVFESSEVGVIEEAEQVALSEPNVGKTTDEISGLAPQREFLPNAEDIKKQYPEGSVAEGLVFESSEASAFKETQQVALLGSNIGKNTEDEVSEFAQQEEVKPKAEDKQEQYPEGEHEAREIEIDEKHERLVFESSEVAKQFLEELKQESGVGSHSGAGGSHDHSLKIDGEIVTDSDEEADSDEDHNGNELFDSAALTALLKAATDESSNSGSVTISSQDGTRLFSVERPAGLGSSVRSLKPASRPVRSNLFTSSDLTASGDLENNLSAEEKKKLENLQQIRIKFLRLLHKLGYSPEDSMAGQVLYRLALIGGMHSGQLFNLEFAKTRALQLESDEKDDFDFSLNVLVIGKSGTGKSATINSILGEERSEVHAFEAATNAVKEIVGTVDGIRIRIIDTPGLGSSAVDQNVNRKNLSSVKKIIKKCPPDIVLYVDRLDTQTKDLNDLPLLRSITSSLGPSIWRNAIVTLTHAASAPPDGPSGSPLSYEVFVAQRSHMVQQSIGQAVGDLRMMNPSLMNPVSLVENHPSCRKNKDGQKVLPNGQSWRPQLLLLCYSLKILSEANSLSKAQSRVDQKKLFGFRVRSPPLPYILSSLLQSRTHPKLSDQGIDNGDSDVDFADLSDSGSEDEEDEYDQLPPFMPLKKAQLAALSKEQKQAYFEEYDYRVKLLQKKQLKEELKRIKEIKRKKMDGDVYNNNPEDVDQDDGAPATVPVPLPDMTLPPSFDGDNPAYRYRFLEPTTQFLARPVLDTHGWDHDCGYDGVNVEHSLAIASQFPTALAVQLTKDKKEFNIHFDSSVAAKHGDNGSTMAGFDIQHVGKQLGYTVRGETKLKNLKRNKIAVGASVTLLGENTATGFKIEDYITLGKRLILVGSTGTVRSQGDAAYGTNLEVRLREADYPIGQNQSSLGLSLVKWRGDLALGANLQSQFAVGRSSKIAIRMGLNNKRSGQISIRTSSSDQVQLALVGIIPLVMAIYRTIRPGVSDNYSIY